MGSGEHCEAPKRERDAAWHSALAMAVGHQQEAPSEIAMNALHLHGNDNPGVPGPGGDWRTAASAFEQVNRPWVRLADRSVRRS